MHPHPRRAARGSAPLPPGSASHPPAAPAPLRGASRPRAASRALRVLVTVALTATLAGCERGDRAAPAGRAAGAEVPVATVDGVPITAAELARRVRRVTGGDAEAAADRQLRASLLDQLVEERLLLAEAARRGLTVPAAEVEAAARAAEAAMGREGLERELKAEGLSPEEWRARLGETLLIRALLSTIPPPKPISEHDVRAHYEAHRAEYARPELRRARILTVATRAEAEALRARLAAGADFAAVAREKSISPEKDAGGDLGFVPAGQLPPEFDEALARLEPGQLSPVVESPYGFHLLRLEERRAARQAPLEEVRDEIRETLGRARTEEAHERWLADLRAKAKIEILDPELRDANGKK